MKRRFSDEADEKAKTTKGSAEFKELCSLLSTINEANLGIEEGHINRIQMLLTDLDILHTAVYEEFDLLMETVLKITLDGHPYIFRHILENGPFTTFNGAKIRRDSFHSNTMSLVWYLFSNVQSLVFKKWDEKSLLAVIEEMILKNKVNCVIPFLALLTDNRIKAKNINGANVLHSLLFKIQIRSYYPVEVQALHRILSEIVKDQRIQSLIHDKDYFGVSPLDLAQQIKLDDAIKTLSNDAQLDVTQLPEYGIGVLDLSQGKLNKKLQSFISLIQNREREKTGSEESSPYPYFPGHIICAKGTCNAWGGWRGHAVSKGKEAVAEFDAMRVLLAQWDDSYLTAKLDTCVKDLNLPTSLKNKFPPVNTRMSKGELCQKDATIADVFSNMCNALVVFDGASRPSADLMIIDGQEDRLGQLALLGDLKSENLRFHFTYAKIEMNVIQLSRLFAYFTHFPSMIFDCGIFHEAGGHNLTIDTNENGELNYFDSNLGRTATFPDANTLAQFLITQSAKDLLMVDAHGQVTFSFDAYQFSPTATQHSPLSQSSMGFSDLHWAIMTKDDISFTSLLRDPHILLKLKLQDVFGLTPLMLAIKSENCPYVLRLLAAERGNEDLMLTHSDLLDFSKLSTEIFHAVIMKLLYEYENVICGEFTDNRGIKLQDEINKRFPTTTLMTMLSNRHLNDRYAFLYYLKKVGYVIDFQEAGSNKGTENDLITLAMMGLLDFNFKDVHGTTILMLAAKNDCVTQMEVIVRKEVKDNPKARLVDVNQVDEHGMTALMWAVNEGNMYAAIVLRNANADVTIKNNRGESAMDLAQTQRHANQFIKVLNSFNNEQMTPPLTPLFILTKNAESTANPSPTRVFLNCVSLKSESRRVKR